jgi:succinyl-CoA synthetase beta subunit
VWSTYEHPRPPRTLATESEVCKFLLLTLEALNLRPDIHELEINPVIVNEKGIFAADARVSIRMTATT